MKTRATKKSEKADRISMRLKEPIASRFIKVVEASRRSKTSIIDECLEKVLPELEKQLAKAA